MRGAGERVVDYLPGPLGIDRAFEAVVTGAVGASWWAVLVAVLPTSLYAEGLVRCREGFARSPEQLARGLRGRLLTAPLLLGVLVAFWVLWIGLSALLCLVYRLFSSTPVRTVPLVLAAVCTGSWLAGQTSGYVLTIRLVTGYDRADAGVVGIGAIAAVAFLLYLNHVVTLLGYLLALQLHESGALRSTRTTKPVTGPAGTGLPVRAL